jgi:tetratricopeptide (TPR) repeat protein
MFERAHEVSPRDSLVRMALGRAYLLGQRPDLALPHLQAGLSGFDGAPLRSLLGNAYALVGQDQLAEEMFRTGTRWFPGGYPPLYVSYGRFLAARGRDAEAARELGRALAIDPKLAEAHYLLGHLRAGSGDPAGAVMALRRFLEFAPPGDPREEPTKAFLRRLEGRGPPD